MKQKLVTRPYAQTARAESAEATGHRIVNAFLARLMSQWFDEITLDRIAEDAGVTVQTVIRRFGGKEGLLLGAIDTFTHRVNDSRVTAPGDIAGLVKNLLADYEQTGDAVIRLLALEDRHEALKQPLDLGRRWHRTWLADILASELKPLSATHRKRALDALVIATDVYTWKLLRRDMGRSLSETESTMKRMIHAAIAEFVTPHTTGDPR